MIPGVNRFNGLHEFIGRCLLEDVAARASLDAAQHIFWAAVRERMSTFIFGNSLRRASVTARPVRCGMSKSVIRTSGCSSLALRRAFLTSTASPTISRFRCRSRQETMPRRTTGWSSARSSRIRWLARGWRHPSAASGCEQEPTLQVEASAGRGKRGLISCRIRVAEKSYCANSLTGGGEPSIQGKPRDQPGRPGARDKARFAKAHRTGGFAATHPPVFLMASEILCVHFSSVVRRVPSMKQARFGFGAGSGRNTRPPAS